MWVKHNAPPRIPLRVKIRGTKEYAGMMELADMQDLGSCAAMRWGSNPHARTTKTGCFWSQKFQKQPVFVFGRHIESCFDAMRLQSIKKDMKLNTSS